MSRESRGQAETGLVISEDAILVVETRLVRDAIKVGVHGATELPRGAVSGPVIADPPVVAQALRKLWRELNLQNRQVTVTLLSPGYAMRALRLPNIPLGEQRRLVRGELEEVGALSFGSGAFDFLWVPLPPEGNKRQADAYVYYTNDATVEGVRQALRLAGLQLEYLEPFSLTMMRAYLASMPQRQPIALLCPAEKHSDLCIHDGNQVRHLRRIPAGWAEFARKDATTGLGFMYDREYDREERSQESGPGGLARLPFLLGPEEEASHGELDSASTEDSVGSSSGLRRSSSMAFLASEVMRSLAFYAREYEEWARPQMLAILSPANIVDDFRTLLADSLSIPLVEADALAAFDLASPALSLGPRNAQQSYLAAIGAAIGDIEAAIPRVDVSQQETAAKTRRNAPVVLLMGMAASTVWMIMSAIAAITLALLQSNRETESVRLDQEIAAIKTQRTPLLNYQKISNAATAAATNAQIPAAAILGRLAKSSTPGVSVTSLHITPDGKVSVEGKALDTLSIARFVSNLGQGQSVQAPAFEMMKQDADQSLTFRIAGRSHAPAPAAKADHHPDNPQESNL
jgi:Tfp pilus assembly PilM family ATPase